MIKDSIFPKDVFFIPELEDCEYYNEKNVNLNRISFLVRKGEDVFKVTYKRRIVNGLRVELEAYVNDWAWHTFTVVTDIHREEAAIFWAMLDKHRWDIG